MRDRVMCAAENFVYLPAQEDYAPSADWRLPLDGEIQRYVNQEFPLPPPDGSCVVYSVPKQPIKRTELQANKAEEKVFQSLKTLDIPGLWILFFQGNVYGGKSYRNDRDGKMMIREHDFVIFTQYQGRRNVVLAEVKSTSDMKVEGIKTSDAKMIKNSKRSAQHQLRDHFEMLHLKDDDTRGQPSCHIFWPFLSSTTKDPSNRKTQRWREDGELHVFSETFASLPTFKDWFQSTVLSSEKNTEGDLWDSLLQRFIILSCGVFVDEIHRGMLALLYQEQVDLLHRTSNGKPLIIHGAAGTGKTFLVLRKLYKLYQEGLLHEKARALYICYWPGIRCDFIHKLQQLGIAHLVDTQRFFISQDGFGKGSNEAYKHIFMDESEAICLSFEERVITTTFQEIFRRYELGNSNPNEEPGFLWFLVDINQASLFLPKHSPNILKTPDVILTKVMRSTCTIYSVFKQFYQEPIPRMLAASKLPAYQNLQGISIGHNISGPPIYWVDSTTGTSSLHTLVLIILDLCSAKGIKPNDLCVLPFLVNHDYIPDTVNKEISRHFVEHGFMPQGLANVESFVSASKPFHFVMPWVLRVKGLEFKVVIMIIDDEDFDFADAEDRRKVYIMASRCTCLLVLLSPESVKNNIDKYHVIEKYPFSLL